MKAANSAASLSKCLLLWLLSARTLFAGEAFVHPGLLNSREDLARIKTAVDVRQEPIFSGYEVFRSHPASQANYKIKGPFPEIGRNPTIHSGDYDSDANAAYQCAIMWCITGDHAFADKSKEIINAWSAKLKSVTGRDAILMAGLGPFKMVNAAEIIRYTDAGWSQADIEQAERPFREVIYPVIENFAPFANGNWDTASIKTMMAIAVFCDDRAMFERALRYYVNGAGDGCLTHYIINETGQCQESGRDQQHTQLGLAHLGDCCEIAWHQGLDLYGYDDNLLLKGFEYTARYNLGGNVPFAETLDRTGKYHHLVISTNGRGEFRAVFEEIYHHYVNCRGIPAPNTQRAAERIRPEGPGGPGADHVGFGTLLFTQMPKKGSAQTHNLPAAPAGITFHDSENAIKLSWIAPIGAANYTIKRATGTAAFETIAREVAATDFTDTKVTAGQTYRYVISASNPAGQSADSFPASICAGLPQPWSHRDIGNVAVPGNVNFEGNQFTIEGTGKNISGANEQFQFVSAPLDADGAIVCRYVPQVSSQLSQFGLMLRASKDQAAPEVSLLLTPESNGRIEAPVWNVRLNSHDAAGVNTTARSEALSEPAVTYGRLTGNCWLKLERSGNTFTGFVSDDGKMWAQVGVVNLPMNRQASAGLAVCSGLTKIPTTVMFDHVTLTNR